MINYDEIKYKFILFCTETLNIQLIPIFFDSRSEAERYFVEEYCKQDSSMPFDFLSEHYAECGGILAIFQVADNVANYEEHGDRYDSTGKEGFKDRDDYIEKIYGHFSFSK